MSRNGRIEILKANLINKNNTRKNGLLYDSPITARQGLGVYNCLMERKKILKMLEETKPMNFHCNPGLYKNGSKKPQMKKGMKIDTISIKLMITKGKGCIRSPSLSNTVTNTYGNNKTEVMTERRKAMINIRAIHSYSIKKYKHDKPINPIRKQFIIDTSAESLTLPQLNNNNLLLSTPITKDASTSTKIIPKKQSNSTYKKPNQIKPLIFHPLNLNQDRLNELSEPTNSPRTKRGSIVGETSLREMKLKIALETADDKDLSLLIKRLNH